jgi:hypothetical protein
MIQIILKHSIFPLRFYYYHKFLDSLRPNISKMWIFPSSWLTLRKHTSNTGFILICKYWLTAVQWNSMLEQCWDFFRILWKIFLWNNFRSRQQVSGNWGKW